MRTKFFQIFDTLMKQNPETVFLSMIKHDLETFGFNVGNKNGALDKDLHGELASIGVNNSSSV